MHIPAKKSLGQNFLKSKEAIRSIIEAGNLSKNDTVLEIGPGKGALTVELLSSAGKVIAFEKDHRLIPVLQEQFAQEINAGSFEVREEDILEFIPSQQRLGTSQYKLIANIPYYITGIVIRQFLTTEIQPERMVLLVQKEVGQRIVARDEKESLLSISVKAYGKPRYVQTVKAKYFSPEPKVDSAIISIEDISKAFFDGFSEEEFFNVVRTGFAHKRKVLAGNLREQFPKAPEIISTLALGDKIRAEDITLEDWKKIVVELKKSA